MLDHQVISSVDWSLKINQNLNSSPHWQVTCCKLFSMATPLTS